MTIDSKNESIRYSQNSSMNISRKSKKSRNKKGIKIVNSKTNSVESQCESPVHSPLPVLPPPYLPAINYTER